MTSREIRQQFLDFFRSKQHAIVDSSPVVPFDDPTLMFTNAGMNQFKDVFLGTGSRPYRRAADTQKCIRAGGKHNDLDDVGQDTYHHTFFEMLGNWSFGDYFKKEAISWAWDLLTGIWGIDKSRLHATYFQGDESEGLAPDREAAELWRTVTDINPANIHPGSKKDNFWEMGDTGPCGPCSEIHIDLTPDESGRGLVNAGDPRVIEIWNLVFIQFNRAGDGRLSALPAKHVDTGMGFERLCAVLQGMHRNRLGQTSNYDTDVFTPIFGAIRERTGAPAYTGTLPSDEATERRSDEGGGTSHTHQLMVDISYRVIADHVRCLTFALTDGAIPSNEGRGYVLRRILRRAVRYGRQYLHMHEPFLCDLVAPLVAHMGDVFPELQRGPDPNHPRDNVSHVAGLIREEETSFLKTLDRGIRLFDEAAEHATKHHHGRISGGDAFKLHDTYGFPIDLTELMAEERGLTIDIGEYERLMEEARERARQDKNLDAIGEILAIPEEHLSTATDDSFKYSGFELESKFLFPTGAHVNGGDQWVSQGIIGLVFDRTCFYAEQGGQAGDTGSIQFPGLPGLPVRNTLRSGDIVVHLVDPAPLTGGAGRPEPGSMARLVVDASTRRPIMQNHTSTHIMNWALREVLGDHVQQKGSLVDPEKTRFDFSHNKPLAEDEIARIEALCNQQVEQDLAVHARELPLAIAQRINGVRAVFGEKYPDPVRVVSIGRELDGLADKADRPIAELEPLLSDPQWRHYSVEFCGGTHLKRSGEAVRFVLTSEEAVAKGIRRIVGISGDAAKQAAAFGAEMLGEVEALLAAAGGHGSPDHEDLPARLAAFQQKLSGATIPQLIRHRIQQRIADVQKLVKRQEKAAAADAGSAVMDRVAELFASAPEVGGVKVVVGEVPPAPADALRGAIDWVRQKTAASAVLLGFADEGKVTLMAGMSKTVVDQGLKAGDLIRQIAPLVGGKGGGRPDMAQGGGTDPAGLAKALEQARTVLNSSLA